MICYSNPGSHPFISKEEREYLQTELGQLKRNNDLPATPWFSILTSIPMIALVCAQVNKIHKIKNNQMQSQNVTHRFVGSISGDRRFYFFPCSKLNINIVFISDWFLIWISSDWSRLGLLYYGQRFTQIYERSAAIFN